MFQNVCKIVWVSAVGMLVYKLVMSNERGGSGVVMPCCLAYVLGGLELAVLKALGRGARWPNFCVNSFASLYAGALRQFITGRIGWCCLCSFINPLMVGANGLILTYFHLVS